MNANNASASAIAINVLTAPGTAFAVLRERPTLLVPLLLLMAAGALTAFLYMNGVDIQWFFEQQARQNPNVTDEQIEQLSQFIGGVPQAGIAVVLTCAAAVSVSVVLLLQALYFMIVTWITRDGLSYKHWFSMVAWCSLPSLLRALASTVNLLTSDVSLMPQEAVNPLSLANLAGFDAADGGALTRLLANVDPTTLWSLVLMILCYRAFTARSLAAATGIVLLPTAALISLTLVF